MSFFNSIPEAIADLRQGKIIIVVDDEQRENEGDLIMVAEKVTPATLNFMVQNCSGIICTPITLEIANKFDLPPMVSHNTEMFGTSFTVSIDYKYGTTSGVSVSDRAKTINALVAPQTKAEDFGRPGHVFPLLAHPDGLKHRRGHTEATIALMQLASFPPIGVLSELITSEGEMMRGREIFEFAEKFKLKVVRIEDIASFRAGA
jgi:3,4-dihydroxy 2-butanone 4-phosphate synthase/GTP cyclohydrolase II